MKAKEQRGPAAPPEGDQAERKTSRSNNNTTAPDSAKGGGPPRTHNKASGKKGKPPPPGNGATAQQSQPDTEVERERRHREARAKCEGLAREPHILDRLTEDLERNGMVGEQRAAKLIYLAVTSRLLDQPVSAVVKGPSSVGKNFVADKVLAFFPSSAVCRLTGMSERALAYSDVPLKHRALVVAEAAGLAVGVGAYLMRSLISEGSIQYETVESGPEGLRPRLIERKGPTALLVTTTALRLDAELETRLFSIPIHATCRV